eukprot:357808-Chlamydomonas_euryale.AAC.7
MGRVTGSTATLGMPVFRPQAAQVTRLACMISLINVESEPRVTGSGLSLGVRVVSVDPEVKQQSGAAATRPPSRSIPRQATPPRRPAAAPKIQRPSPCLLAFRGLRWAH